MYSQPRLRRKFQIVCNSSPNRGARVASVSRDDDNESRVMAWNLGSHRSAELVALSGCGSPRVALAIPELDWDALTPRLVLREAIRHRVIGLAVTAPRAGLLPPNVREGLATAHRDATLRAMTQAADLRALLDHFADARVPVLMMKGQAFSAAVYGDWAVRGVSADADFLVPPQRLEAAHAVLTRLVMRVVSTVDGSRRWLAGSGAITIGFTTKEATRLRTSSASICIGDPCLGPPHGRGANRCGSGGPRLSYTGVPSR
jgi:hypothetical protein